jgi:hypothetical protein
MWRLWAVACEVAAAAKAGAMASVETVAAPSMAPIRNTRRFKMVPPGGEPPFRDSASIRHDSTG